MNNEIEEKINKLIKKLMCDYECGRTIDEVKTFDHPDEEVVIEIIGSLRKILFPGYYRNKSYRVYTVRNNVSMLTEDVAFKLINQIRIVLRYDEKYENADAIAGVATGAIAQGALVADSQRSVNMSRLMFRQHLTETLLHTIRTR